ncbi:MAG: S1 family peptidase [Bacillus sp. (in: firmicutes)]
MNKIIIGPLFCIFATILLISVFPKTSSANYFEPSELRESIKYREEMGLDTNVDYIKEIINKKENKKSKEVHGVWLSNEEFNEIENRIKLQKENVPIIKEYLTNSLGSEIFGGMYINQSEGGRVYIGVTKNINELKDEIIDHVYSLYPDKSKIKFIRVTKTEKQLDTLHEKIWLEKDKLINQDIEILTLSTNFPNQTVDIAVKSITPVVKTKLTELYGENINIFEGSPAIKEARSTYTRPLIGGLEIYNSDVGWCSGGFTAAINGYWHYITAAHCGKSTGSYMQGGYVFGTISKYKLTGNIDAVAIYLPTQSHGSNGVYGSSNLTSYTKNASESVGDYVCKSGRTTGNTCGTIKSTNYSVSSWNNTDLTATSYTSDAGDSGATVYNSSTLKGIHTGSSNGLCALFSSRKHNE